MLVCYNYYFLSKLLQLADVRDRAVLLFYLMEDNFLGFANSFPLRPRIRCVL